ncbi:MAG: hypothetical protein A2X64_11415 [Ignavibacteria bacterium GWF2_33_9]|nr:MAG: hypothetical protein A2X64_11415 [Ignavibacteria bacterium GWF2_33_9]
MVQWKTIINVALGALDLGTWYDFFSGADDDFIGKDDFLGNAGNFWNGDGDNLYSYNYSLPKLDQQTYYPCYNYHYYLQNQGNLQFMFKTILY